MTNALTATCAGKPRPRISRAATTAATPTCLSNRPPRRRRRFARKPWKDVRSKPSATMVKASLIEQNDNELPAKPTQRTGEPEATRASQRSGMIEAEHRSPRALQSRISSPRLPYPQATITLQKKSWRSSSIRGEKNPKKLYSRNFLLPSEGRYWSPSLGLGFSSILGVRRLLHA